MPTNLKIAPRLLSFAAAASVLLAVVNADAQSPATSSVADAQTAGRAFDGTYRAVSSAKVNQMYIAEKGNMAVCPDRTPGPLTHRAGSSAVHPTPQAIRSTELSGGRASWRCMLPSPAVPGQWSWTSAAA